MTTSLHEQFNNNNSSSANTDPASRVAPSSLASMDSTLMLPHLPGSAAPLPSPSAASADKDQYFALLQPQAQHPLHAGQQHQFQQHQHQHTAAKPQRSEDPRASNTATEDTETNMRLRDCNLLAEAAKRAQIACVTRDLEEVQL